MVNLIISDVKSNSLSGNGYVRQYHFVDVVGSYGERAAVARYGIGCNHKGLGDAPIHWMDEDFNALPLGPLAGRNGWRADGGSTGTVVDRGGRVLRINPRPRRVISMTNDVPDRPNRQQHISFRVMVRNAIQPSLAKIEVVTDRVNWGKKFQLYFGSSMRVNYRRNGASRIIVASTVMDRWYAIRLEIDMNARLLDIYVDGGLAASNIPIRPGPITALGVIGWDRPGAVFFDDFVGREF